MAFDQNSIPKDLRPLNIPRTLPEETRIAPVSSSGRNPEGLLPNLPCISSPASISPNYPATLADVGFTRVAYSNMSLGAAGWYPVMPTSVHSGPGGNLTSGICHNPNSRARIGGSASDQASDEGGEDSVSGKKVKFLCSFGGKILPRPSDGMLRYVGGQTRIISVRRDVSFGEIVQKMVDVCGQNVIIKYQLPDEDLDALVSVSCPDDVENMMDEYEKLANRSSDGSAKLRVFLFSLSELDSPGMVHFGELQDSGQRYVEAVNGIINGVSGGIARKESIASATSTQNSDLSGTEALDFSAPIQGDVTGPASTGTLSPKANSTTPRDPSPRVVPVDPRLVIDSEASVTPLGVPLNQSGPQAVTAHPEHELERPVPVTPQQQQVGSEYQQLGFNIRPPAPYLETFVDPHQEIANRVDYVQVPSQIGFPAQVMGTIGPVYTHPQFHDNASSVSSQHYIPAMHMTMAPPSHVGIRPNVVLPVTQTQQVRSEIRPDDGQSGATVFHLPVGQSYHAYPAQVPPSVIGGGYGWHQVPQPEQVVFSEGWLPHQQAMISEKIPRFNGCYMCEKCLPHAHSDTMVQDQRGSTANPVVDSTSVYHSLRFEDKMRAEPMSRVAVSGALGEGGVEQQGAGAHQKILGHIDQEVRKSQLGVAGATRSAEHQYDNDRINLHKVDNLDHPKASFPQGVVGLPVGGQPPYAAVMGTYSQPSHENALQQYAVPSQNQYKQETLLNKPVNNDLFRGGGMLQMSDHLVHELPNEYSGKLLTAPKEGTPDSYDHLREIDGRLENLRVCPPEVLASNDKRKPLMDNTRQEVPTESQKQQISAKEPYLVDTFIKPSIEFHPNYLKANEMLPSLNDVSYVHTSRPLETCEATKPPLLSNPTAYQQSMLGINHLAPYEVSHGNHTFAGVDSVHVAERIHSAEWTVDPSQLQPMLLPADLDIAASSGNPLVSLSPVHRVMDAQDSSNSLFSNQDPWDLQHDTHFPPPLPSKIAIRKEGLGTRAPFDENQMFNYGELPNSNSGASIAEVRLEDGFLQPASNIEVDFGSEHTRTTQGSAEEMIKRELQGVAEGVAASVLKSSMPSDPDLTKLERKETVCEAIQDTKVRNDVELHKAKIEETKSKLPEKTNFGFPISDGIGRLQIINNSDLEELRELGSGTFGTVYHGKWRGTDVAIKRINDRCFAGKPSEQERMRDDFWNEAIKLADLHHPNVVAFYGVVLDGPGGSVATVTEYMVNGSLRNALQKNERNLDKRKRLLIAMDVAFGMEYLHGKNIVHFDLKSDNLLVNLRDPHRPICKVGDLGLSKVKCQTLISGGVRGTLPWMAPELLNGSSSLVSEKVDVFSFGIVMWELLTGEEPYADLHYGAIIGGIVSNTLRPAVPESCDSEWRTLMEICWSAEPSERPSFTEIANELRSMAARIPPKAQNQQQAASTQPQAKS